jgi:hypothetical protein
MQTGIYYITQDVLADLPNRHKDAKPDEIQVLSLSAITFSSESILTLSSSMRMRCCMLR